MDSNLVSLANGGIFIWRFCFPQLAMVTGWERVFWKRKSISQPQRYISVQSLWNRHGVIVLSSLKYLLLLKMFTLHQDKVQKWIPFDFYIDFLRGNFLESLRDLLKSLRFMINLSRILKKYLSYELTLMEKLDYYEDFLDTEKAESGWDQQNPPTGTLFCYCLLLWWLWVTILAVQSQKTRSRAATVPYPSYRLNWERQNCD